jgi:hypothetical protein
MTGRGHEMDPEPFDIVVRVSQGGQFLFAGIRRSGIHSPDGKRPPEQFHDLIFDLLSGNFDIIIQKVLMHWVLQPYLKWKDLLVLTFH